MTLMDRFLEGARSPLVGFKFLFAGPKLWKWAVVPSVFFALLLTFGFAQVFTSLSTWMSPLLLEFYQSFSHLPIIGEWFLPGAIGLRWISNISHVILFLSSLLIWVYTAYVATRVFFVPFSSMMAERTLVYLGCLSHAKTSTATQVRRFLRSVRTGIVQVLFLSMLGVLLFFVALIPGFQPFAALFGFLIVSFDCADYALECADMTFRQKLSVFWHHIPEYLGFATVVGLTFLLPILNLIFLPALVIGAARMTAGFRGVWKTEGRL